MNLKKSIEIYGLIPGYGQDDRERDISMDIPSASAPTAVSLDRAGEAAPRLRGCWLVLAWIAWAALVILTLSVFVASIPVYAAQLQTMGASTTTCTSQYLTLNTAHGLRDLGLSVWSYA